MRSATKRKPDIRPAVVEPAAPAPAEASSTALAPRSDGANVVLMFERLARDPNVDVTKLERLIAMQKEILAHNAKAAFDAAFAEMQGEIPEISEKGEIVVEGKVRSTYATNEDIQRLAKPILQKHGFAIRFRNEFTSDGKLKIVGILSHRSGHSEQDEFVAAADTSGSKNAIQALGSTRSYGQRYTTIALLNIATRGTDDDGQTAENYKQPEPPEGFDDWLLDLSAVADEGTPKLSHTWNHSKLEYRRHLTTTSPQTWEQLKKKAALTTKAGKTEHAS